MLVTLSIPVRTRSRYALFVFFSLIVCLPAFAQFQGVPSSAISMGISNNPTGRANLPSLGPNGLANALQPFLPNCCSFPALTGSEIKAPLVLEHHHHRHHNDDALGGDFIATVPYEIGYQPEADANNPSSDEAAVKREKADSDDAAEDSDDDMDAEAAEPPEPVVAQPSTVLVFKDGHQAGVVNYAIVGDALFDFDEERTHKILLADLDLAATQKINDSLGVEFKLPPGTSPR